MEDRKVSGTSEREPAGLTPHTSGPASEHASEQGWGTNIEERTRLPEGKQNADGGTDYDYGARDFGDSAVDTSSAQPKGSLAKESRKIQKKEKDAA